MEGKVYMVYEGSICIYYHTYGIRFPYLPLSTIVCTGKMRPSFSDGSPFLEKLSMHAAFGPLMTSADRQSSR